jgi:pSer/pThr/pTyr-binding forkhead associated (FHA) protein
MHNIKEKIINSFIPKAVLVPLTDEAKLSITTVQNNEKIIPISNFPFKVGRESRMGESERGLFVKFRIMTNHLKPNNDIYLIDNNEHHMEISKEHFVIENTENEFSIMDRNSTMGTKLNNIEIGKEKSRFSHILKDGDIIKIGSNHSKYEYQFLVLNDQ